MIDPNGDEIKIKETFSDKNGKISEGSFRIPSDGIAGIWTINAKSGANFDNAEFEVLKDISEGMVVSVSEIVKLDQVNNFINIEVLGAEQTVTIEILDENGEIIEEISFPASDEGEIKTPWMIPKDTPPGTYTIMASDAFSSAETTFEVP